MTRRARTLSEAERGVWAAYAHDVLPLRPQPPPPGGLPVAPPPASRPAAAAVMPRPAPRAAAPAFLVVGERPPGVDDATWRKLLRGGLGTPRRLDLHGRTAARALDALQGFLHEAHGRRLRTVEVITGRGSGETGGILRRELPLWLNRPELRVLVLAAAHPTPGNMGAVRLLLRRPRGER